LEPREQEAFFEAIEHYKALKERQREFKQKMEIKDIRSEEHKQGETALWTRIVEKKGIDVTNLISEDYKDLKKQVTEEKRHKFLEELEKNFDSDEELTQEN